MRRTFAEKLVSAAVIIAAIRQFRRREALQIIKVYDQDANDYDA